jgi:hypothetical protein
MGNFLDGERGLGLRCVSRRSFADSAIAGQGRHDGRKAEHGP